MSSFSNVAAISNVKSNRQKSLYKQKLVISLFVERITPKFSGRALKYLLVKSQIDFGLRILLV